MESEGFKLDKHSKISHGMRVPDGYFEAFKASMAEKLPYNQAAENPESLVAQRRTLWQRTRPYIYMAAMFAGVWCMTQMFGLMKNNNAPFNIENNHVITAALSNSEFFDDYIVESVDEYDLLDGLYTQGADIKQYKF